MFIVLYFILAISSIQVGIRPRCDCRVYRPECVNVCRYYNYKLPNREYYNKPIQYVPTIPKEYLNNSPIQITKTVYKDKSDEQKIKTVYRERETDKNDIGLIDTEDSSPYTKKRDMVNKIYTKNRKKSDNLNFCALLYYLDQYKDDLNISEDNYNEIKTGFFNEYKLNEKICDKNIVGKRDGAILKHGGTIKKTKINKKANFFKRLIGSDEDVKVEELEVNKDKSNSKKVRLIEEEPVIPITSENKIVTTTKYVDKISTVNNTIIHTVYIPSKDYQNPLYDYFAKDQNNNKYKTINSESNQIDNQSTIKNILSQTRPPVSTFTVTNTITVTETKPPVTSKIIRKKYRKSNKDCESDCQSNNNIKKRKHNEKNSNVVDNKLLNVDSTNNENSNEFSENKRKKSKRKKNKKFLLEEKMDKKDVIKRLLNILVEEKKIKKEEKNTDEIKVEEKQNQTKDNDNDLLLKIYNLLLKQKEIPKTISEDKIKSKDKNDIDKNNKYQIKTSSIPISTTNKIFETIQTVPGSVVTVTVTKDHNIIKTVVKDSISTITQPIQEIMNTITSKIKGKVETVTQTENKIITNVIDKEIINTVYNTINTAELKTDKISTQVKYPQEDTIEKGISTENPIGKKVIVPPNQENNKSIKLSFTSSNISSTIKPIIKNKYITKKVTEEPKTSTITTINIKTEYTTSLRSKNTTITKNINNDGEEVTEGILDKIFKPFISLAQINNKDSTENKEIEKTEDDKKNENNSNTGTNNNNKKSKNKNDKDKKNENNPNTDTNDNNKKYKNNNDNIEKEKNKIIKQIIDKKIKANDNFDEDLEKKKKEIVNNIIAGNDRLKESNDENVKNIIKRKVDEAIKTQDDIGKKKIELNLVIKKKKKEDMKKDEKKVKVKVVKVYKNKINNEKNKTIVNNDNQNKNKIPQNDVGNRNNLLDLLI
ncbi:hypothetical protein SLOPH_2471 [Spraguea lophii 42_110]|uniref:Uncharacterized protein n=1 Tax=Spraguea lophii (strain 42_110) TaxID=1358809 RepID=S7XL57_SPRLO|nr:hypothetical protein SLOPH_2471 [Spraguea lophii 42_110]